MIRSKHLKVAGLTLLLLALLTAGALRFLPHLPCPAEGVAFTPDRRAFMRLKNRVGAPTREDFDERVTLETLLSPGEDRGRWSESRAGRVEGYVVEVVEGGMEAANCFSSRERDVHIHVAARPDAPRREWLVLEVTPRTRSWAAEWGRDWSAAALKEELVGRRCRFEGWLMFDREHADKSENTAPGAQGNWRATAWELHPVTRIEVLK
ncbi:MAG TPA: hypothetical protein VN282_26020 [Pyrinomonadaceae bacterium]|nr:hypothetical protein [Pyrinomonadaceae bacterium]